MQSVIKSAQLPTVQDVLTKARESGIEGLSYNRVNRILEGAGQPLPLTRGALWANEAQTALDAGTTRALTPWEQKVYDRAVINQETAADVAQFQNLNGVPVTTTQIETILKGAGLQLQGRQPYREPGADATEPAKNPVPPEYPGGLPGRQERGGMYGVSFEVPRNITGEVPRHPGLRGIFRNARRRNKAGWKGQTDTILTSARGILNNPLLKRQFLQGQ
jgi:hypothetical protein